MVIFTENSDDAAKVVEISKKNDMKAIIAGSVEEADERSVEVLPLKTTLSSEEFLLKQ